MHGVQCHDALRFIRLLVCHPTGPPLAPNLSPSEPSARASSSSPSYAGTIWEAWTGDATHSDGSKNHPMFTGGVGVWLYESGLGLKFRHAITRAGIAEDAAIVTAADAALAVSSLGFDPRIRAGLSSAHTLTALHLAAEITASGVHPTSTSQILSLLASAGVPELDSPISAPVLVPTLTLAPDAAVVRAIGSASGWTRTPQGPAQASWSWTESHNAAGTDHSSKSFALSASVPSGVTGRIAIPLELVRDLALASGASSGVEITIRASADNDGPLESTQQPAVLMRAVLYVNSQLESRQSDSFDIDAASCSSLGSVSGDEIHLCIRPDQPASAPLTAWPRITSPPRLASWSDVEGLGRLHFGNGPASVLDWSTSYLLFGTGIGRFSVLAIAGPAGSWRELE